MNESVDDEVLDRFSVDSLEGSCGKSVAEPSTVADKNPIRSSVPFRLHEESQNDRGQPFLGFVPPSNPGEGRISWNCEVDETVLMSKGLQLNKDGSFSKSPREGGRNNLPFIMPATRVALIRQRRKKNSEQIRGLKASETTRRLGKVAPGEADTLPEMSRLKASGNLTDSMKEALYKKYMGKQRDPSKEKFGVGDLLPKFNKDLSAEGKDKRERSSKKNRSDVQLPMIEKPLKLSYFERYQKKKGFDPRSISLKGQKPVKDTVRSKFGDSSRDTLSEVSSRVTATATEEEEEEEELFYRKIMAEESFKVEDLVSDYSDRSLGENRTEKAAERKKEVKIMKAKRSSNAITNGSALPSRTLVTISPGRKSSHCCGTDHETLSKAELVSKARAYGNLANTRNIVKMQLKSFRRYWECPGNETLEVSKCHLKRESFLPPLKDVRIGSGQRRGIL